MEKEEIKKIRSLMKEYHNRPVFDGIVSLVGLDSAYLLSYLMSLSAAFECRDRMDGSGFFYRAMDVIEEETTFSHFQQRRCFDKLVKAGLISIKRSKVSTGPLGDKDPRRITHFRVEIDRVLSVLDDYSTALSLSRMQDKETLGCNFRKLNGNNNNEYNNTNKYDEGLFFLRRKNSKHFQTESAVSSLTSSLPEGSPPTKSIREAIRTDGLPTSPRKGFSIKVSPIIQQLIDHWNELGLRRHRPNSKVFVQSVKTLHSFLSGKFFTNSSEPDLQGRAFTPDEISRSIFEFSKAALDPDYWPNGVFKEKFRGLSLGEFLYNPRWDKEMRSPFLMFLNQPAKLTKEAIREKIPLVEDKHPKVSSVLVDFCREQIGKKLNNREINCCRLGAERLVKFFDRFMFYLSQRSPEELVHDMVDAITRDMESTGHHFSAGWLCSDYTFEVRLPKLLGINVHRRERAIVEDG